MKSSSGDYTLAIDIFYIYTKPSPADLSPQQGHLLICQFRLLISTHESVTSRSRLTNLDSQDDIMHSQNQLSFATCYITTLSHHAARLTLLQWVINLTDLYHIRQTVTEN